VIKKGSSTNTLNEINWIMVGRIKLYNPSLEKSRSVGEKRISVVSGGDEYLMAEKLNIPRSPWDEVESDTFEQGRLF
jgi:hypothetical protein